MAELADIGVVGLGVMGANLALNLAEHGFRVAVYDRDFSKADALSQGEYGARFVTCSTEDTLLAAIAPPRPVLMLVPAGGPTDDAIQSLSKLASPGDVLVDAGNSDFHDTRRRTAKLEAQGLSFLGIGVSGGAEGARTGPAMMAGGSRAIWGRVAPMLQAIAARYGDVPCADWLGPDGAGHFVKTVHNGIEYADMQMIAEVYGLMRDGLAQDASFIGATFSEWAVGPLASYLVEIAAEVAESVDPDTGRAILDVIADKAGQKGTGRWSVIEAQRLGTVASTIEAAVGARNLSAATYLRKMLVETSRGKPGIDVSVSDLHDALLAGKVIAYAQGFDLLARASQEFDWQLDLASVARVWRAGCIIRSGMLDDIANAFDASPNVPLMAVPDFRQHLADVMPALRRVVSAAVLSGLPVPALSSALSFRDQLALPRGTANMLQGLRDRFGQHGFERTDREGGGFHGPWI